MANSYLGSFTLRHASTLTSRSSGRRKKPRRPLSSLLGKTENPEKRFR